SQRPLRFPSSPCPEVYVPPEARTTAVPGPARAGAGQRRTGRDRSRTRSVSTRSLARRRSSRTEVQALRRVVRWPPLISSDSTARSAVVKDGMAVGRTGAAWMAGVPLGTVPVTDVRAVIPGSLLGVARA